MNYPCQSCGASFEYAPGAMALRCPYCGFEQRVAASTQQIREHSYADYAGLPAKPVATLAAHVLVCQKCGARTETDALSDRCQFCSAPLVTDTGALDQITPEAVLPFQLDNRGVRTVLGKWTSSRWFAPSALKKVTEAESLRGTYLPHWTFDAQTTSDYSGQRGDYYYTTETYTETNSDGQTETRTRQVRHTRWSSASGRVARAFDDVLVPATTHVTEQQLDKLTPWPLEHAQPFQSDYLAGFQTLRYDIQPDAGLTEAKSRMDPVIRDDCRHDIGGDEQRVDRVDTRYDAVTFKLMLLPVWILAYVYAGKTFQVMVNAHTGEVIGQRPYSVGKIVAAITVAVLIIVGIVLAYVLSK